MSAKQMGMVWDLDLPLNQQAVLLALADHANHDGSEARPSISFIAWKTGQSEPTVKRMLRALRDSGIIEATKYPNGGRGKCVVYQLHLDRGPKKEPYEHPEKGINLTPFSEDTQSNPDQKEIKSDTKGDHSSDPPTVLEPSYNTHYVRVVGSSNENQDQKPQAAIAASPLVSAGLFPEPPLSESDQFIVECVQRVPGAANIPPREIINHVHECVETLGFQLQDADLKAEMLRFRDHWRTRRENQGNKRWRKWRVALTNWITRIRPAPTTSNTIDLYPDLDDPEIFRQVVG